MKALFLIFLLIPLLELYLLIKVGAAVGAVATLFLVVFTALLGAVLVRAQGLSTLSRIQAQMGQGQVPAMEMMEGICLFIAGTLLLIPGFFTDSVGFILLTPPLRRMAIHYFVARRMMRNPSRGQFNHEHSDSTAKPSGRVIDIDHRE